jgi:hypothetical protein
MTAPQDEPEADPANVLAVLRRQLDAAHSERDAALAQKAALAEVLQIINRSPGDAAPVFEALVEKAAHLCHAAFGALLTFDGTHFRAGAYSYCVTNSYGLQRAGSMDSAAVFSR